MNGRVAFVAGAAVLAVVTVAVVARHGDSRPASSPASTASTSTTVTTTPGEADPMVGLPRTADGARAAALRLTTLAGRAATMPVDDAVALQRQVATTDGGNVLADRLRAGLVGLDRIGDRSAMRFWVAPIAADLVTATSASADVDVWYVGVLDVPNLRTSQQWRTVRYRLVWERGAWRDDDERAVDGPEPQHLYGAQADDVGGFGARLVGFTPAVTP